MTVALSYFKFVVAWRNNQWRRLRVWRDVLMRLSNLSG